MQQNVKKCSFSRFQDKSIDNNLNNHFDVFPRNTSSQLIKTINGVLVEATYIKNNVTFYFLCYIVICMCHITKLE